MSCLRYFNIWVVDDQIVKEDDEFKMNSDSLPFYHEITTVDSILI